MKLSELLMRTHPRKIYVSLQIMSAPEPSFPPPPPPVGIATAPVNILPSNGFTNGPHDSGGGGLRAGGDPALTAQPSYDEWDDEWDDDDESSNSTVGTSGGQVSVVVCFI